MALCTAPRVSATPDERLAEVLVDIRESCSRRIFLDDCDHCGHTCIVHDIGVDMRPGRLGSVVGKHCAACCDKHPCDDRQQVAYIMPARAERSGTLARVSVLREETPISIPMYSRSRCLACKAGVQCDKDHGCLCGHTKAAHVVLSWNEHARCVGDAQTCTCQKYTADNL